MTENLFSDTTFRVIQFAPGQSPRQVGQTEVYPSRHAAALAIRGRKGAVVRDDNRREYKVYLKEKTT